MNLDSSFRVDDGITLVQNFKHLLQEQLGNITTQREDTRLPQTLRNVILGKLLRLKNATRRLRGELDVVRAQVQRPFSQLVSQEVKYLLGKSIIHTKHTVQRVEDHNKENDGHQDNRIDRAGTKHKKHTPELQKPIQKPPIQKITETQIKPSYKSPALRNQILKELEELRQLEQKERVVRKLNESRHRSVSEVKKKAEPVTELDHMVSKQSQSMIHYEESAVQRVASSTTFQTQYSEVEAILGKNIKDVNDIQIKVPEVRPTTITLLCANKHEYYVGSTIGKLPHGHGRLYNCCSKIPLQIPEAVEFYTGSFARGKFDGYGTLTTRQGVKYVGTFKDGLKHGQGSLFYKGKMQLASWSNDKFIKAI